MRRNELPDTCLSVLASTGQLIIIKKGEHGYYPTDWDTGDRAENREIADTHNKRRGISDIQETAMIAGSMFGWTLPGASPQWYLNNAKYVNSKHTGKATHCTLNKKLLIKVYLENYGS